MYYLCSNRIFRASMVCIVELSNFENLSYVSNRNYNYNCCRVVSCRAVSRRYIETASIISSMNNPAKKKKKSKQVIINRYQFFFSWWIKCFHIIIIIISLIFTLLPTPDSVPLSAHTQTLSQLPYIHTYHTYINRPPGPPTTFLPHSFKSHKPPS